MFAVDRTARSPIPRWALLGVILGGLLLMHGLSVHGSHSAMPTSGAGAMSAVMSAAEDVTMPGHEHVSMEVLCLAVLPVGLLLLLAGRTGRSVRRAGAPALLTAVPFARSRSPDPPSPILLSICRC